MLSKDEIKRYARQITLDEIGEEGQLLLKNANVVIIGAGGLGIPVLQYLVAAGVGTITIVDGDTVSLSNLHRQIIFGSADIGKMKVIVAKEKMQQLNSSIHIQTIPSFLSEDNADEIISGADVVVDASDNFITRYLINDTCVKYSLPFVSGSIVKFSGQLSVFNYNEGPTYRCLYPMISNELGNCSLEGVLGAHVAVIGSLQASEVLKIILGIGKVLSGKLLVYDALATSFSFFEFQKVNLTVLEAKLEKVKLPLINQFLLQSNSVVVDLRDFWEVPQLAYEQLLVIPFSEIVDSFDLLKNYNTILFVCSSELRSKVAKEKCQKIFPDKQVDYLEGGLESILLQ